MGYFPSPTKNNLGGKWAESGVKKSSIDDMKFDGIDKNSEKSVGCTTAITSGKDIIEDKINNNNNSSNNNCNNNSGDNTKNDRNEKYKIFTGFSNNTSRQTSGNYSSNNSTNNSVNNVPTNNGINHNNNCAAENNGFRLTESMALIHAREILTLCNRFVI